MFCAGVSETPSYKAEVAERQPLPRCWYKGSSCMRVDVTRIYSLQSWRGPGRRCVLSQGFSLVPAADNTLALPVNTSFLPGTEHALRLLLRQLWGLSGEAWDVKKIYRKVKGWGNLAGGKKVLCFLVVGNSGTGPGFLNLAFRESTGLAIPLHE